MQKHTKVYLSHLLDNAGMDPHECLCEVCGQIMVDVNHIVPRGSGGTKKEEHIDNLMGMCRWCHHEFADKKHLKQILINIHKYFLSTFTPIFQGRPTEKDLIELDI